MFMGFYGRSWGGNNRCPRNDEKADKKIEIEEKRIEIERDKARELSRLADAKEEELEFKREEARPPEEKDGLIHIMCARYKCGAMMWKRRYEVALKPAYENHWCDICSKFVQDALQYLKDITHDDKESSSHAHYLFLSRVTREVAGHPRDEREYYIRKKE